MTDIHRWLRTQLDYDEQSARAMTHAICNVEGVWSPSRVLADIAAKRQLVGLHGPMLIYPGHPHFSDAHLTREAMWLCRSCEPPRQFRRTESWPCHTIRALALPYTDRPGYRDEWKPTMWFHDAHVEGVHVEVKPR